MQKPFFYDSATRRLPLIEEFRELITHYELLQILILNNIKTRYKRSALGVFWTMLNPLLYMGVMSFAFSHLFRFSVANYPVYLLAGLIAWNFFSQTTTQAISTLVWGGSLMKRIYLPRVIFAVAAVGSGLINLLLSCIPLIIIMLLTHQKIYMTWWFLPFALIILAAVSLGISLFISILAIFFADVVDLYQVLLQAAFYVTPIMYPENILPAKLHRWLFLNPIYDVVKVFRTPIYQGHIPSIQSMISAILAATIVLMIGWWSFTRKADEIIYRI